MLPVVVFQRSRLSRVSSIWSQKICRRNCNCFYSQAFVTGSLAVLAVPYASYGVCSTSLSTKVKEGLLEDSENPVLLFETPHNFFVVVVLISGLRR